MSASASSRALEFLRGALFVCLGLVCACARPAPIGGDSPMPVSFLPAPGEFLTSAGDRLSPEEFMRRARTAAYVLVGEGHGNPCDHEAERRVLNLLAHNPEPPALGLEMVPASLNPVLQEFFAGGFAPEELEARLDWKRTWGHPFARYLPVFKAAREWRLPLAGLNVPPEVVRRLSKAAQEYAPAAQADGSFDPEPALAALSKEDRAQLPERIIGPAPAQEAYLREAMASHPNRPDAADPRQLARFELIQSVWDTAMAEQAARLRRETGRPMLVLAGAAHVEGGLGIARRLAVLDPGAEVLLVAPWRGDSFDPAAAQVRFYCPESFESRMGMVLESRAFGGEAQVLVAEVRRGGRAEAAGLRPGDVVTRAGGRRMRGLTTLHLAGSAAFRERKNLVLEVRRGADCYSVDLGPLGQQATQQNGRQATQQNGRQATQQNGQQAAQQKGPQPAQLPEQLPVQLPAAPPPTEPRP